MAPTNRDDARSGKVIPPVVEDILQHGESDAVEFKETTGQRNEATKTLSAMLNGNGGRVVFGIRPNNTVRGLQIGEGTLEELSQTFSRDIDPPVVADIQHIDVGDGHYVIDVQMPPGQLKPYRYRGGYYKRSGRTTIPMPQDEADRLLMDRLFGTRRWETEPSTWTVNDLDQGAIVETLVEAVRRNRIAAGSPLGPTDVLQGLNLLASGGSTVLNGAVALFATSSAAPIADYPQLGLQTATFDQAGNLIQTTTQFGGAFSLLQTTMAALSLTIAPTSGAPEGLVRPDFTVYPDISLREALANAVCHRDYSTTSALIAVSIHPERLEIKSPGTLHFGLTPQELYQPHSSQPFNPLMAQVFYLRGIIERFGIGVSRMVDAAAAQGLPRPNIDTQQRAVEVTFYAKIDARTHVLNVLHQQGEATTNDIAEIVGRSERRVRGILRELRDEGLVVSTTPPRSKLARYRLTESTN